MFELLERLVSAYERYVEAFDARCENMTAYDERMAAAREREVAKGGQVFVEHRQAPALAEHDEEPGGER